MPLADRATSLGIAHENVFRAPRLHQTRPAPDSTSALGAKRRTMPRFCVTRLTVNLHASHNNAAHANAPQPRYGAEGALHELGLPSKW